MIGGSQAAVYYGEPRFTRDVDVVAGRGPPQIRALLARFPAPDFYVSGEAAREAGEPRGQFNIIHPASGLKIDIFVNRDTPYDRLRLERRRRLPLVPGRDAWFARAEDVILYKLIYYRDGQSELHLRDVIGILRVSGDGSTRAISPSGPSASGSAPSGTRCSSEPGTNDAGAQRVVVGRAEDGAEAMISRREFLRGLTLAGAANLAGLRPQFAAAAPPPRTARPQSFS